MDILEYLDNFFREEAPGPESDILWSPEPDQVPDLLEDSEFDMFLRALDRSTEEIDGTHDFAGMGRYLSDSGAGPDQLRGVLSNSKGIFGELKVLEQLNQSGDGLEYRMPADTNHPGVDIIGYNEQGLPVRQIQVKFTDNADYVEEALREAAPGVEIFTNSEMAGRFPGQVMDSGISNSELTKEAEEALRRIKEATGFARDISGQPGVMPSVREINRWIVS